MRVSEDLTTKKGKCSIMSNYRYVLMEDGEIVLMSAKMAWGYKLYSSWVIDKCIEKRDETGLANKTVRFSRHLEDIEI